jgi:predicted MPP superfamily phosphohydrolase
MTPVGSVLIHAAAGCCLWLMLVNRLLMFIPSPVAKVLAIAACFALITGGCVVVGFKAHRRPWIFVPVVVLCLAVVGEARRVYIRASCAGSGPVGTTPLAADLTDPLTTTDLACHRYEVVHPEWGGRRLRIVHITDLHVLASQPMEYYEEVLDIARQADPDLALFTGDFVSKLDDLDRLKQVLRPVARLGNFAVLGNHDYWSGPQEVRKVVKASGLELLTNESRLIRIHGREVLVTGLDHPWGPEAGPVPRAEDGVLHLVLSHTPDNIYTIAESSADFVFSGHYHGGQVRLPLVGPIIIPSIYGRRFDHGHYVVNGTHLFVSSGIGTGYPPLRIFCPPDLFVVDILGTAGL